MAYSFPTVLFLSLTLHALAQSRPRQAPAPAAAPSRDEAAIRQVMADQADAWNKGSIAVLRPAEGQTAVAGLLLRHREMVPEKKGRGYWRYLHPPVP